MCIRKVFSDGVVRNLIRGKIESKSSRTKASTPVQFFDGLRGDLRVTFEEGNWAAWLRDLLEAPRYGSAGVAHARKNGLRNDSKSDRIDARKLSEQLVAMNNIKSGLSRRARGLRTLK